MDTKKEEWFATWFDTDYYHTLYQNRSEEEAQQFIANLLKFLKLEKGSKILDLACGNGRHARQIADAGYNTKGVDLSSNSISIAKRKIGSRDNLSFDVQDMRESLNTKFDAVFNLFTSFGYFQDLKDNQKVINAIDTMLEKDGKFVIDFMNASKVVRNLVPKESKHLDGLDFNITRRVENNIIIKNIEVIDGQEKHNFQERVQAIHLEDFENLFENSNLVVTQVYGDYELNQFDIADSNRLIIIGSKI